MPTSKRKPTDTEMLDEITARKINVSFNPLTRVWHAWSNDWACHGAARSVRTAISRAMSAEKRALTGGEK